VVIYRKRDQSVCNNYDSIDLNYGKEIMEDKAEGKIFESHYELMSTELEEEDKELCIRDF